MPTQQRFQKQGELIKWRTFLPTILTISQVLPTVIYRQMLLGGPRCLALLCILYAFMAASCLFVGDKGPHKLEQYFIFLLVASVFGIFGYLVISAKSFDWLTRIVSAASALMLIAVIGDFYWVSKGAPPFTYVIFVVVIPLLLTATSLRTGNAPVWQSLVPLLVPLITILPFYFLWRTSSTGKIAISEGTTAMALVPIAWALLGAVAYLGRKARVVHTADVPKKRLKLKHTLKIQEVMRQRSKGIL